MSSFLSSLNLSPFALVAIGLLVLAVIIVILVGWIIAIDRRTRGVVDGLEVERRKVAEMQVIVSQRVAQGGGPRRGAGRPGPGGAGGPGAGAGRGAAGAGGAGAPRTSGAPGGGPGRGQQNPGAARVGVPQNAEMGSHRVRAAQPAAGAGAAGMPGAGAGARGAGAAGGAAGRPAGQPSPAAEEEQAFAAWVQERAQAMEQGRKRPLRGRAPRDAQSAHEISVPRGMDKTGGVPMEQWTGPVGRGARGQRGQVARQATAAAQAQARQAAAQGAAAGDPRVPRRGAQAGDPRASRQGGQQDAARMQAQAGRSGQPQREGGRPGRDPRAGHPAGDGRGGQRAAQAAGDSRAQRAAQAARAPRAGDARPWQNPRANGRQSSQPRGGRGGNPANSGYVQVDASVARQPHSYAQGNPSSPLQPRAGHRPMTQPNAAARPVDEEPIPVQVEAASSTGLFRHKKKAAESPRGKHAR